MPSPSFPASGLKLFPRPSLAPSQVLTYPLDVYNMNIVPYQTAARCLRAYAAAGCKVLIFVGEGASPRQVAREINEHLKGELVVSQHLHYWTSNTVVCYGCYG